jgi:16S rRNA (adenine1518-N6/adenine1519-N6)-dimethyltransferase
LKAKKRLGQNYLVDQEIRDLIIEAAEISAKDTIIEVGPGLGVLTEKLAAAAGRVIAVELDETLVSRLRRKTERQAGIEIVHADILKVDLRNLLGGVASYKVVANIPYYITSPILHLFMHAELRPALMVIMMQKEVALDVTAGPGHMTFLAVSMQMFSRPVIVCAVPAASFDPKPAVDSAVVIFNMLKEITLPVGEMDQFLELVHAGFAAPRKKMRNSLALGMKVEPCEAELLLEEAGIDTQNRPGAVTLDEWVSLYRLMEARHC